MGWCIKETLRLLPPAGNYQRMSFQNDLMLGGKWNLVRGMPIVIDIFALHMDPNTWGGDAAHFVPERWERDQPHPYSYMPFASGPRSCIGKEFSLMEQKIDAEFNPNQFFVGASLPVELKIRPRPTSLVSVC